LYISQTGLYIGDATGLGRSPGQAGTWDVVLGHWLLGAGGIGNGAVEPQKLGHQGV
jgi:hypothetical protein